MDEPWFWPVLSVCFIFLMAIPCVMFILVIICHHKRKSRDDSDDSSIDSDVSSSTSSLTIPERFQRRHRHISRSRAHHLTGFRTPPPPYVSCIEPRNIFVTTSPPPPYESHITDDPTINSSTAANFSLTERIENAQMRSPNESSITGINILPIETNEHQITTQLNQSSQSFITMINIPTTEDIEDSKLKVSYSSSLMIMNPSVQTLEV